MGCGIIAKMSCVESLWLASELKSQSLPDDFWFQIARVCDFDLIQQVNNCSFSNDQPTIFILSSLITWKLTYIWYIKLNSVSCFIKLMQLIGYK